MISVIFDDAVDLAEGRRRVPERLARVRAAPARRARRRARARRGGDRPDLLVHRRRRRARPGPAARDPGLVRPSPARLGRRAWPTSRASAASRSSTRSSPDPNRLRASSACRSRDVVRGRRDVKRLGRAAMSSTRGTPNTWCAGVGWLGASARARRRDVRPQPRRPRPGKRRRAASPTAGRSGSARSPRSRIGPGLSPRRPRERRQRGHRRRGPDGPRRKPARSHPPHQGQDPRACRPGLPRGRRGSSRSTTAPR